MTQTFDTSRVGGGTYELEQDANGNYKLKSVGFAQVNKLNLPDLKTSDTPVQKILPVEDEKKTEVADPYKKLFKQTEDMGRAGGQDYSGVTLKTPKLKDAEVYGNELRKKLSKIDLPAASLNRPKETEERINNASQKVLDMLESITARNSK